MEQMEKQIATQEQSTNDVQMRLATFKFTLKKDQSFNHIRSQLISEMLNKSSVFINFDDKFSQTSEQIYLLWIKLFKHMTQFKIHQMCMYYSGLNKQYNQLRISAASTTLKTIENIKFSELLSLTISKNDQTIGKCFIVNIEILNLLNCQNLQQMFINGNNVSRFNCFAKWSNKNLQKLHIYQNPIKSIQSLAKINFKNKNIKDLTLQYNSQNVENEDLSILMKLNVQNIKQLEIMLTKRIFNQKIEKMIKKRFPEMQNFYKGN